MCEPTTIIAGVSAVAGLALSVKQMSDQNARSAENANNSREAYFLKASQINSRIRQEGVAASQKKEDARLKTLRSQGAAKAAAGAGNVKGVSVDKLLADYERSEGTFRDRTDEQLEATSQALRFDQVGAQREADQRIASVPPQGMENVFGAAIQGGAQVYSGYKFGQKVRSGEDLN